ncbi:AraC family transcriptional regulator [Ferrimonas marina]|uniref:AraC-type DNA-binding protein n=1 Tax=Ferrimonas marina TaxID=299255 RepID=A0A1M5NSW6_9GAMM|nr:AraC family transcriptional regulator [Ferrimonas marina]SHG92600.1 AraC-type DNA-binding protein [Ferrimonas marina]
MTDTLIQQAEQLATQEGYNPTRLPGVGVYKTSAAQAKIPLCYSQGVIFVLQGRKRVFLEQQAFDYHPDNYLVLTLPLPAECETLVTPGEPMLSLMIHFDAGVLNELVRLFGEHRQLPQGSGQLGESKALYVNTLNPDLRTLLERLVSCLHSPLQADALGDALLRELMFRLLQADESGSLFALAMQNTHLARMERTLKHLHNHFEQPMDVDQLAQMANMSASSFHRNFRQLTASSPLQYLKKLRLTRARELLIDQGVKVKQAAAQVGYESPTQFSREFKRYFGHTPQQLGREASAIAID